MAGPRHPQGQQFWFAVQVDGLKVKPEKQESLKKMDRPGELYQEHEKGCPNCVNNVGVFECSPAHALIRG